MLAHYQPVRFADYQSLERAVQKMGLLGAV